MRSGRLARYFFDEVGQVCKRDGCNHGSVGLSPVAVKLKHRSYDHFQRVNHFRLSLSLSGVRLSPQGLVHHGKISAPVQFTNCMTVPLRLQFCTPRNADIS